MTSKVSASPSRQTPKGKRVAFGIAGGRVQFFEIEDGRAVDRNDHIAHFHPRLFGRGIKREARGGRRRWPGAADGHLLPVAFDQVIQRRPGSKFFGGIAQRFAAVGGQAAKAKDHVARLQFGRAMGRGLDLFDHKGFAFDAVVHDEGEEDQERQDES